MAQETDCIFKLREKLYDLSIQMQGLGNMPSFAMHKEHEDKE
jgi:hypothetical protein